MAAHGWTVPQVLAHTPAELRELVRQGRIARGEAPDGAHASPDEVRRYLRRLRSDR